MTRETIRLLRRVGYFASLKRHGRGSPRELRPHPDLSVRPGPPSLGSGFGPTPGRREMPPDARQFPVGNLHKQGLELITPGSDPTHYNGRKR